MDVLCLLVLLAVSVAAREYTVMIPSQLSKVGSYDTFVIEWDGNNYVLNKRGPDAPHGTFYTVDSNCLVIRKHFVCKLKDAEVSSFPRLFHLDDYDRCLARTDGLYCLGTFDLTPRVQPHHTYQLLKAYSDESYRHFNRTRIHRGYCVSSRCPREALRNASQRFENCVDEWAKTRKLRASINTFHYCHTHAHKHAVQPMTPAQRLFLQCVYAIIGINVIATIYDVTAGKDAKKNSLITAFSIPGNWRRLTGIHEAGDPRLTALAPLNGFRVVAMFISTYAHANVLHFSFHPQNPEFLEKQTQRLDGIILSDGTSLIQALVMMSCFLTCYSLLLFSQKRSLNIFMLPLCIMKRFIRTSPVSLLVIGFGATWWIHIREGPLVPSTIGLESRACQSKFWSHIFYTNNIVDSSEYCVLPTWFLPVDMHMYIVACALTLIMWSHRSKALMLYVALFFASSILIAVVAYVKEYKSMLYLAVPEAIRRIFRDSPSFTEFYISSWGALQACFLGLIMAHIQFELEERRIKLSNYKWFVYLHYGVLPLHVFWAVGGKFARTQSSLIFHTLHITLDRPIFCIIVAITLFGLIHVDGPIRKFNCWNGFTKMSRLLLTVMLLHWCVNMTIAARPVAFGTSIIDVIVDWVSTNCITYLLAVPITLLVEIPMQKFLGLLLF